jgi:hypothetical protein
VPSPPDAPVADCVNFALISCLTCPCVRRLLQDSSKKYTFVTVLPAKKKTARRAKNTLHGCNACTTAVANAARSPIGVSDFREYALYTSAAVAGTAITGLMLGRVGLGVGRHGGVARDGDPSRDRLMLRHAWPSVHRSIIG